MKRILVFPAGSEISHEIFNALKYSKFVQLFGGTSINDHSEFMYKNLIEGFPRVTDDSFIDFLNEVIARYKIDCIYPAHDSVCYVLSENKEKIHAQVIITDFKTTKICRSKKETYNLFANEKFIPKVYENADDVLDYPVFLKPEVGEGSKGTKKVNNRQELDFEIKKNPSVLICEYLPGKEFTVDCFTNRRGELLSVNVRTRERIKSGISVKSQNVYLNDEVKVIANCINNKLAFRGAWFFQIKLDEHGMYKLLEISPRIPGTMGLSRNLGINFPLLTLFDFWDMEVEVSQAKYDIQVDRALSSAYKINVDYEHVYVDYDDTLIINNEINTLLMLFLYQCVNKNKKVHLISKHRGDFQIEIDKYKLPEILFEEICLLNEQEEKTDYITEKSAIFIDDSYKERKKVQEQLRIPVFDVDMVESLIDWRM